MKILNLGQSLFEVVVALAVSTVIITALVALASNSIRNATFSKNNTVASRYAQEATEWLRSQRDNDPTVFLSNAQGVWCMQTLSWENPQRLCDAGEEISQTPFVRNISFSTGTFVVNGENKTLITANVSVSWNDAQGAHEVRNSTDFSDWRQR